MDGAFGNSASQNKAIAKYNNNNGIGPHHCHETFCDIIM